MTSAVRPVSPEREEHWQRTWGALDPRTVPPGPPAAGGGARYLLTMFPYPSGDPHMGHAEVFAIDGAIARYRRRRGHHVLDPPGGPALGERRHRPRRAPGHLHRGEHRDPGGLDPPLRGELRPLPPAAHPRRGVLPVDAVAVPAAVPPGSGLPRRGLGELVPAGRDCA